MIDLLQILIIRRLFGQFTSVVQIFKHGIGELVAKTLTSASVTFWDHSRDRIRLLVERVRPCHCVDRPLAPLENDLPRRGIGWSGLALSPLVREFRQWPCSGRVSQVGRPVRLCSVGSAVPIFEMVGVVLQ
ncbi:hypothetical protein ABZ801_30525 [Actinomadura sp. NPDC047616]|uniref:hypothetical protein n=1 Tax=Actinomadura sp. NPDC047616 TaxID=3155914 RepID=UPI0033EF59BF